ncbi:hypothetical protein E2P81_ATG01429 [Venturia nashicola]|uniref:Uncharacterized protein n=1 Tax=Venturia nashicola TaxID=86259 RepID=A0A4Z1PC66_9PEZI|nr:hypothetical protein E6O75_ATG01461 [Venturia nashicola]TLD38886.1 hypothetical protein E2P81_ATG01429 [Venturia nashicola]
MSSEKLPHWTPFSNEPTPLKGRSNFKSMATSVANIIYPRRRSTVNADEDSLSKEITVDQDTLANASSHPLNVYPEAVHNSPSASTAHDLQPRTEPCNTLARAQTHHLRKPPQQLQFVFPIASENTMTPDKIQRYRNDIKAIEGRLNHVGSDVRPEYNRMIAETVVGSVKILGDEIWDAVRQMIEGVRSGQDQVEEDRSSPSVPSAQKAKVTQPPMKTHADVPAPPQGADEFKYPTIFRAQLSEKQDGMYRHRVRRLNDQLTRAVALGERQFTHFLAEALIGLRQCLQIHVDSAEETCASEKADFEANLEAFDSKMKKSCQKGQDGLYKDLSRRIEDSRCHCRGNSAEQVEILSETTAGVLGE